MDKTLSIIIDLIGPKHGAIKELAEYLGITPNVVTNWKNGSNKSYRKYLKEIANYFGVSVDYLMGNEESDTKKIPVSKKDDMYEIFKQLLEERHVTAYQVSKATGISTGSLSDWKNGRSSPKTEKLKKIADYFGVSVDYLMGNEDTDTKKAPASKRDEREEEFVEMFKHLNPEQQDLVIAQLKGILDTHKK